MVGDTEAAVKWMRAQSNHNGKVGILGISHDGGLSGRLVFRGSTERLNLGQEVQAGEQVGLLSPEAKSFFWNINLAQPLASPAAEPAAVAEKKLSTVSE